MTPMHPVATDFCGACCYLRSHPTGAFCAFTEEFIDVDPHGRCICLDARIDKAQRVFNTLMAIKQHEAVEW